MPQHVGLYLIHIIYLRRMLRRDDHGCHLNGLIILIAHRYLSLSVGTQVGNLPVLSHDSETLGHTLRQIGRHGHEHVRLVSGIAKHHALVARANAIEFVFIRTSIGSVHTLSYVGTLLMNHVDDTAGLAVKPIFGAVVSNTSHDIPHDLLDINVGLRPYLPSHDDGPRCQKRLACAANISHRRRNACWRHVSFGL